MRVKNFFEIRLKICECIERAGRGQYSVGYQPKLHHQQQYNKKMALVIELLELVVYGLARVISYQITLNNGFCSERTSTKNTVFILEAISISHQSHLGIEYNVNDKGF